MLCVLENTIFGYHASDTGQGIYNAVSSHDTTGAQHAVTAYLYKVAQHGTDLAKPSLHVAIGGMKGNISLVGAEIGSDAACPHVRAIA